METKNDRPLKNEDNDRFEQTPITEQIVSIQALGKLFEAADAWSDDEMDTIVAQLAIDAGFSRDNVEVAAELAETPLDLCSEPQATLALEADRPVTDGGIEQRRSTIASLAPDRDFDTDTGFVHFRNVRAGLEEIVDALSDLNKRLRIQYETEYGKFRTEFVRDDDDRIYHVEYNWNEDSQEWLPIGSEEVRSMKVIR